MKIPMQLLSLVIILILTLASISIAEPPTTAPSTRSLGLTVAILDFDSDLPDVDLGKQIGETLTATLTGEPGFTLVDRASMNKILTEHEVNLTGLVDSDTAVKVGKLVGAKILVTGKAFTLDKNVFITAKLIGTETSLVDGLIVKGKQGDDIGNLVMQLSDKMAARIREAGPKLVADNEELDPLPLLKAKLATLKRPKIVLQITEQHISTVRAIDPPVDTELRMMLTQCGFTVIDASEVNPADAGVKVIIKGEGISELAAHIGNITTCTGRLELNVVDSNNGKTLYTDRITARAADLSEQIAAKTALQKAAHALGIKILQNFADTLPADKKNNH